MDDPTSVVYERFFCPKFTTPIALAQLSAQDGAMCLEGVPWTQAHGQHWLPALSASSARQRWGRALTPAGMFDDPLIDDACSGDRQCTTLSLQTALSEMSRGFSGLFVIPNMASDGGWQFANRAFAPLMWCVLVLLIDRGDPVRLRQAVRRGMPESTRHLAAAVVMRAHALLNRALNKSGRDALTTDQLDDQLGASGLYSRCVSILFPLGGQMVVVRPAAAKALASALFACNIWAPETLHHAPLSMLSAMAALEAPGVACMYGQRNAVSMLAVVRSQAHCAVGPPSAEPMDGRVHELEAYALQLFVVGWNLLVLSRADFAASMAARAMIWGDPVTKYALHNLMSDVWAPSVWRAASYADAVAVITTARLSRYPVPLTLTGDLENRLRLLRTHYGGDVPLDLLLSCSPLSIRNKASERTLVPPISPTQIWRRVWRSAFVMPHPVVVNTTMEDVEEFMAQQPELIQQQRVPLDMLVSGAQRPVQRVVVYGCGPAATNKFAGAIAAFRLMSISYGDRAWNHPSNFVVSADALLVDAQAARPMMLRSLMARVYGRSDCLFHMPFITPIIARELYTLNEMPDQRLRAEAASAVCDLMATLMRLEPPAKGISSARMLMTYDDVKIRIAGADQPWPVTLCTGFMPLFLGPITRRYFERSLLVATPVLYNGYLNTMLAMMRSPLDENVGFWHWPTDVLEAILRYFFLIYMQQQGLIGSQSPVPGIMENNRVLVQALAFLYIHKKLERTDMARIVVPDDGDPCGGGGGDDGGDYAAVAPRNFAKKHYERRNPDKPRDFSWKHLVRAPDHLLEAGTLDLHPLQGNSIYHDLAARTARYERVETIPTAIAASEYSSLQFKQSISEPGERGNRHSVRSIVRVVGRAVDTMTPVTDLARGIVEVSGTQDDTQDYVPRPKGRVKRDKSGGAERDKKEKKKRASSTATTTTTKELIDEDAAGEENNTDTNGGGGAAEVNQSDGDNNSMLDPSHPIHKRVRNGQYNAARLHSARTSSQAPETSPLASSSSAAVAQVDAFSSSEAVAQLRRNNGNKKRHESGESKGGADLALLRERADKLRADRVQNIHHTGACLSRFVVMAVTAIAGTSDTLPVSFVRAVLGTAYATYGVGCRGFSWETSPHNARNHLHDIETSLETVTNNARTASMNHLYAPSPTAQPSEITDYVVTSLFDLELAPWVSRSAVSRNNNDMMLLHNKVPGTRLLSDYRQWDVPMSSTMLRGASGASTPMYAYSMQLEVDVTKVRDVGHPHTTFSEASNRDRSAQERDAPYDFGMAVWMWRTLPRPPTERLAYDASGVELVAAVAGAMQSYSKAKAT